MILSSITIYNINVYTTLILHYLSSYITDIHKIIRSYGVVLWEITSYGDAPLDGMEAKDIVEAAQDGTLQHSRL